MTGPLDLGRSSGDDPIPNLPPDLARVLRDPGVIIAQDAAVFEAIAAWSNAPSNTASAKPRPRPMPNPGCGFPCGMWPDCECGGGAY